jgi:uncharacterized linocin/CFP29 family protein
MPDDVARLPWSEDQWASLRRTVQEAAGKARVASSFLPLVGPLPPGQASVPAMWMKESDELEPRQRGEAAKRFEIDESETVPLNTISYEVYLTGQQVEDPDLAVAKQLLREAADVVGRAEDSIIFNGHGGGSDLPDHAPPTPTYQVHVPRETPGLLDDRGLPPGLEPPAELTLRVKKDDSQDLIERIGDAVLELERRGHYGPFACVLGHDLYKTAIKPSSSLALPKDRITAFLDGGPLHRSSVIPEHQGVVVSLAGSPIDLVVASDVNVKFLQVNLEPRYVLRVSERFVLRLKRPTARCRLLSEADVTEKKTPENQKEGENAEGPNKTINP